MKIVIASNNEHKTQEIASLLQSKNITVVSQAQLLVPEAEETGLTFVENAILKARNACEHTDMPAIADDSGLEVDALAKRPGIYSSRYAGPQALLQELRDVPKARRTARFQCIMVFLKSAIDPTPIICQGTWEGKIAFAPAGTNGFGYDPVFWVPTHRCTAAQLGPELKNKISHRAIALQKIMHCFQSV
ncbi:MAG: RdgB/HAM1 family non-canonical purine NTP pyrophosphatase [bacterium]